MNQRKIFADLPAVVIELFRRKIDLVHRVEEDSAADRAVFEPIDKWYQSHPDRNQQYPPEIMKHVFNAREKNALDQINKYFMSSHNQRDVLLIFGANHNFSLYPDKFPPECIVIPDEFKPYWDGRRRGEFGTPVTPQEMPSHESKDGFAPAVP